MRLPNKVTSYNESILNKLIPILDLLSEEKLSIVELYSKTKEQYGSYLEFIDALDCLFALGKIAYLEEAEAVYYVA